METQARLNYVYPDVVPTSAREVNVKEIRHTKKRLSDKNVKDPTKKDVMKQTLDDVTTPTIYATEIALNLGNGTSKATVLSGACHSTPHNQFPVLCLISAYRIHMREGSMSLGSDFKYVTDLVNTIFRILDLRVKTKMESWARVVMNMLPRVLRGTLPSVAFDAVKTDLTVSDSQVGSSEPKATRTRRRAVTTNKRVRKARRVSANGLCEKYFLSGECKFGKNCWQSHNCPICHSDHFPNCVMKDYQKKDDN